MRFGVNSSIYCCFFFFYEFEHSYVHRRSSQFDIYVSMHVYTFIIVNLRFYYGHFTAFWFFFVALEYCLSCFNAQMNVIIFPWLK